MHNGDKKFRPSDHNAGYARGVKRSWQTGQPAVSARGRVESYLRGDADPLPRSEELLSASSAIGHYVSDLRHTWLGFVPSATESPKMNQRLMEKDITGLVDDVRVALGITPSSPAYAEIAKMPVAVLLGTFGVIAHLEMRGEPRNGYEFRQCSPEEKLALVLRAYESFRENDELGVQIRINQCGGGR